MPIVWDDQMKVGNREIDADHRELISIINEFQQGVLRASGEVDDRRMQIILERLQSYASDHFAREEYIQAVAKYDGYEENRRHHQALRRSLAEYIDKYNSGALGDLRTAAERMSSFLDTWFLDHIVKIDLKMRGKLTTETWR
jgi:hemerythrin